MVSALASSSQSDTVTSLNTTIGDFAGGCHFARTSVTMAARCASICFFGSGVSEQASSLSPRSAEIKIHRLYPSAQR